MLTGTLHIPNDQLGLLEQLELTLGWKFHLSGTVSGAKETARKAGTHKMPPQLEYFRKGNPWRVTDEEVDNMRHEYLTEKYK